jgi:hypothetical protein
VDAQCRRKGAAAQEGALLKQQHVVVWGGNACFRQMFGTAHPSLGGCLAQRKESCCTERCGAQKHVERWGGDACFRQVFGAAHF